jgi:hypothetical protein
MNVLSAVRCRMLIEYCELCRERKQSLYGKFRSTEDDNILYTDRMSVSGGFRVLDEATYFIPVRASGSSRCALKKSNDSMME